MKKQLDIGCSGFTRNHPGFDEVYGIDIVPHPDAPHIKQADLALEPIPFEDNTFDLVTAYDFLEHLPFILYLPTTSEKNINGEWYKVKAEKREVMIELFNEVYRVLKPGGEFYIQTPIYPDKTVFQDPTHLSFWTDDTLNYFAGDYFGFRNHYPHRSRFEQMDKRIVNNHIYATLKARKDIPENAPFQVHY